jgi:two-component system, sensor histidine kinase and response regulator
VAIQTLLIVDDEAFNRSLLNRIFYHDCHIIEAESGQAALDILAEQHVDVVLLDIMMPGLNGMKVLEIIRETTTLVQLPVILITALTENDDVVQGITRGANDYIAKPINVDIVRARVQTQLTLKQYHDERQQLSGQLQAANDLKARLMHVAAHDLKNPLNNMSLMLSLQQDTDNLELMHNLIEIGQDSVRAMRGVIEDFLDMSIFNNGEVQVKAVPVQLDDVLKKVLNQYAAMARYKQIELCPTEVAGTVIADERRLMQALGNLVSNAIKYSPQNRMVVVNTAYSEGYWRVQVIDQGAGIPVDERDTLFDAFQRGSNKPTGGETSTGLGLWIVREMVQVQGGSVGVDCPPEGGSCFWIELPAAEVSEGDFDLAKLAVE